MLPFLKGVFSQWYPSEFKIKNVTYNCCEQYMMAQKALLFEDVVTYDMIMNSKSPAKQKALGRKVQSYNEDVWVKNRYNIVLEGNRAKFNQNPKLRDKLLQTGSLTLCEANPRDRIWGVGLDLNDVLIQDQSKWKGLNLLGTVLMEVRSELKNEY